VLVCCFNYADLIAAWTGPGKFAGNTIIYLMLGNFFFGSIGYFMSNVGYALGDIKMNSLINILKGLIVGIFFYFSAKSYGIVGVLTVMLAFNILIDFSVFSYRLIKLGFLQIGLITNTLNLWIIIVPITTLAGLACNYLVHYFIKPNLYVVKLLVNGGGFLFGFVAILLIVDKVLRFTLTELARNSVQKIRLKKEFIAV